MPVFFVCAGLLGLMAAALTVHVGLMRGRMLGATATSIILLAASALLVVAGLGLKQY